MLLVKHAARYHGVRFLVGDHMTQWFPPHWSSWGRGYVKVMRTGNLEKLCQIACRSTCEDKCPVVIVYDEIDQKANSANPISPESALYEVLHMGRNHRPAGVDDVLWPHDFPVGLWWCARLPGSLRPDLKYTTDRAYLGHTTGAPNVKWIGDAIGDRKLAETLVEYPPGKWLAVDLQ